MKKIILYPSIFYFLFALTALHAQQEPPTNSKQQEYEYLMKMKANPSTGQVDIADVMKARKAADKVSENQLQKSSSIDWEFMGPNNIGGRTRAILIDKDNPNNMIIGSVSGGIFTSEDGGNNWIDHPQNQEFATLSISAIAQAPNGDIYVGTGENYDGRPYGESKMGSPVLPGNGVYKSTDRGVSFQLLEATIPSIEGNLYSQDWISIKSIEISPINPNLVYVATNQGLQISENGGDSWAKANGIPNAYVVYDIEVASDGKAHVLAGEKYYQASDGLNFTDEFTGELPNQFEESATNKVIAMSPSDNNYLYIITISEGARFEDGVIIISTPGCLKKVWQSKDGGETWNVLAEPQDVSYSLLGCQGWFSLSLVVDPMDKERIFVGGASLSSWSSRDGWNYLDGDISPHAVPPNPMTIEFHPKQVNTLYIGTSNGIVKSTDAQSLFPTFTEINQNYTTAEFYSVAASVNGHIMGGAQNNGNIVIASDDNNEPLLKGERISDATGGFCEISKLYPSAIFAARHAGRLWRTPNNNTTPLSSFFDTNIDCLPTTPDGSCNPDGRMDGNPLFITPFTLWEDIFENILTGEIKSKYVTGNCAGEVWMTEEALDFNTIPSWKMIGKTFGNRCISAITVSQNGKTIYAGTTDGRIIRINELDQEIPSTSEFVVSPGQYITDITVFHNPAHIIVGLGNYGQEQNIIESFNASSTDPTFASIQHNLPLMPVYSVVNDIFNPNNIIAGTELGIWQYDAATQTWAEQNDKMGRVPVHSLRFQQMGSVGCDVLYAGTHGRGIYRTTDFTLAGCNTDIVGIEALENQISDIHLFPNPMKSSSSLVFDLEENTDLTLKIFDFQGRVVRREYLGLLTAQKHQFQIEKKDLIAGLYMVVLQSGSQQISRKLMVR